MVMVTSMLVATPSSAQQPDRGPHHSDPRWHALLHATLHSSPGEVIDDATVVVRNGVIVNVSAGAPPPNGARVWDCTGKVVTAGFVEAALGVEAPRSSEDAAGLHWNHERVTPQRSALDGPGVDADTRDALRELGFTVAAIYPEDGIFRGTSAVVALSDGTSAVAQEPASTLAHSAYQAIALERASWGSGAYPGSEMGAIAVVRQALSDAAWHRQRLGVHARHPRQHEPIEPAPALEALQQDVPLLFFTTNELQLLRCAKLAKEFERPAMFVGSGMEFRRLAAIQASNASLIVPLTFSEKPKVSSVAEADQVSLRDLMTWEQAPTNLRRLAAAGVPTAITTSGLDAREDFPERLRQAREHGLADRDALAMLTTVPAKMLGLERRLGVVRSGALAHLAVWDGPVFEEGTRLVDLWIGGRHHSINPDQDSSMLGTWSTSLPISAEEDLLAELEWTEASQIQIRSEEQEFKAHHVRTEEDRVNFLLDGNDFGVPGVLSFFAVIEDDELHGSVRHPDGCVHRWSAHRKEAEERLEDEDHAEGDHEVAAGATAVPEDYGVPLGAYGVRDEISARDLVVRGATVWTSGPRGIVEDGLLVVRDGKVAFAGPLEDAPSWEGLIEIDATGLHVTPGLIDCHSHTGISGSVNEGGQRVTAEVRIEDVINPDDVNWYRQLAGGLTAANQLHGSANAIGGQNCVVKLRWGCALPDEMRIADAMPGIKFALGENPKRVAANTERPEEYPQSRMGVETLIVDRLRAGQDYQEEWDRYQALGPAQQLRAMPPRRDLELEAMAEIVRGERLIHCHSYRQDEILMLCRVAQEFGFTIGTFQHVLEGYKVAEAIREASLGGSTFSDWWAYKFEVIDAIPHNAALMSDVGVITSINSDSSDFARRLNTEAAKAMKYGGMTPDKALALVTLNPAIQLGIEDRVGSLETGKDADFAIWSGSPLSYQSRCVATYIEGQEMFSLERHQESQQEASRERHRIIQKILARNDPEKSKRDGNEKPEETKRQGPVDARAEALWRAGMDPADTLPGECGCNDSLLHQWR